MRIGGLAHPAGRHLRRGRRPASPRCSGATASARPPRCGRSSASRRAGAQVDGSVALRRASRCCGRPTYRLVRGGLGVRARGPVRLRRADRGGEPAAGRARRRRRDYDLVLRALPGAGQARAGSGPARSPAGSSRCSHRPGAAQPTTGCCSSTSRPRAWRPKVVTEVAEVLEPGRRGGAGAAGRAEPGGGTAARRATRWSSPPAGSPGPGRRRCDTARATPALTTVAARRRASGDRMMSTVVLLTLTGLGLAALYFLVASGLSLVFGLADVLNFAHGLFLSVGAYATWWAATTCPARARRARVRARGRRRRARRRRGRRAGRAGADPAALLAAPSSRCWSPSGCRWPASRCCRRSGAPTRGRSRVRSGRRQVTRDRRRQRAQRPAAADRRGGAWCWPRCWRSCAAPGYGLVIRAGVENRAMVTALGIDVRKAFTLVFAIGGAAAALAGALGGVYFGTVSPGQGALAAHLRVHRRGDRRHGLGRRVGVRRGRGRAAAAVRQLLRRGRRRRRLRGGAARASCCWCGRPGSGRDGGSRGMISLRWPARRAGAAVARRCRTPRWTFPALFDGPLNSPGTLQLLAHLPGLRRPGAPATTCCSAAPGCSPSGTRCTSRPASTAPTSWSPGPAGRCGAPRCSRSLGTAVLAGAARRGRAASTGSRSRW